MNSTKMLQILIDGQATLRKEIKKLRLETKEGFKQVNDRLDKQGKSLAYLEEDAPTIDEFDKLEKRVTKLENQAVKN